MKNESWFGFHGKNSGIRRFGLEITYLRPTKLFMQIFTGHLRSDKVWSLIDRRRAEIEIGPTGKCLKWKVSKLMKNSTDCS